MAQQSSFYNTDGTTRTYPSSKHIASKQHVAVYFQSVTTSTWSVIEQTLYDLVNNSIVFVDAPDSALYSQIEIRVADTAAELTESPSDIATVAGAIADVTTVAGSIAAVETVSSNIASIGTVSGAIANVNTVATNVANVNTVATNITSVNAVATNIADVVSVADTIVPNIAEILLADTNAATATTQAGIATTKAGEASTSATNAQLRAWEAEAEKMTADSYATEAEDVFVKVYTSDGDGTFTATPTTEYSALHWAAKSALAAQGDAVNISYDNATSGLTATNVQTAIDEVEGRLDTVESTKAPLASPTFTGTVSVESSIVFEGATANDFETTLTVTDPTADRTITIPNNSGEVLLDSTAGAVIQTTNYTTGTYASGAPNIPFDNTTPQITEGTQFMSFAFTPKKSTSKLKIEVVAHIGNSAAIALQGALFRDSTANAIASATHYVSTAGSLVNVKFTAWVDASSTASTTFTFRAGGSGGTTTTYFNGTGGGALNGTLASSITITEIAQ